MQADSARQISLSAGSSRDGEMPTRRKETSWRPQVPLEMFAERWWASRIKSWEDRGRPKQAPEWARRNSLWATHAWCSQQSHLEPSSPAAKLCRKEASRTGGFLVQLLPD